MSDYTFTARNKQEFRARLLGVINSDFRRDAANTAFDEIIRNGIVRHTICVNGRTMGYEARLNTDGNLVITDLQVIAGRDQSKKPRSLHEIKASAKEQYDFNGFIGRRS